MHDTRKKANMEVWIETERLNIVPPSLTQLESFAALHADIDVMRFIGSGAVRDEMQSRVMLERLVDIWSKRGYSLGMVYKKDSGEYVGRAGLCPWALDEAAIDIEVGYALFPQYWGCGYATELTRALIAWGFEQGGLSRIVGAVQPSHITSQQVLKKAGLHFLKDSNYLGNPIKYFAIDKR